MSRLARIVSTTVLLYGAAHALEAAPPTDSGPAVELDPLTVEGRPPPIPRLRLNPMYPMEARRRWEEGCVVLRFTVRPDGKTDDFAILDSRPLGVFERTVIAAVYKWRYDPADAPRTVIETFEFRNSNYSTQPRYTVIAAGKSPAGVEPGGRVRYRLDMQLQGYAPPKCKPRR